jgi:hypothetical protein
MTRSGISRRVRGSFRYHHWQLTGGTGMIFAGTGAAAPTGFIVRP